MFESKITTCETKIQNFSTTSNRIGSFSGRDSDILVTSTGRPREGERETLDGII